MLDQFPRISVARFRTSSKSMFVFLNMSLLQIGQIGIVSPQYLTYAP
jgi:hypothetical protein